MDEDLVMFWDLLSHWMLTTALQGIFPVHRWALRLRGRHTTTQPKTVLPRLLGSQLWPCNEVWSMDVSRGMVQLPACALPAPFSPLPPVGWQEVK